MSDVSRQRKPHEKGKIPMLYNNHFYDHWREDQQHKQHTRETATQKYNTHTRATSHLNAAHTHIKHTHTHIQHA